MKKNQALWLWKTPASLEEAQALPSFAPVVVPENWVVQRKIHRFCAYAYCSLLLGEDFQGILHTPAPALMGHLAAGISFSHTANIQGLIYHATQKVGLDIEYLQPRILRLAPKFLTEEERFCCTDILSLTLAFSAKEALFKALGLSFRMLFVQKIDFLTQEISVYCPLMDCFFVLYFCSFDDWVMVYWTQSQERFVWEWTQYEKKTNNH